MRSGIVSVQQSLPPPRDHDWQETELAREVLMYLLPDNYRFGEIAAEVDTSCSLAAAGNKSIMSVLEGIAREKNAALIYQHENQPYEQFFKK